MSYEINFSYFIFPCICLLFTVTKIFFNNNILDKILLIILIIFLGFSLSGADYSSYEVIYNSLKNGASLNEIHGEILYKKINELFISFGLEYMWFKIIWYSILYYILYFSLSKLSNNLPFSLFIAYTGFLLYLLTINRQFFSMIVCILGFYLNKIKKNKLSIIINFLGVFIHISSVLPFLYFIFIKKIEKWKINYSKILLISFLALIIRFSLGKFFYKLSFLFEIFGKEEHFKYYANSVSTSIFNLGLINRIFFLFIISLFLKKIISNDILKKLFIFYFIGSIIYISIPNFIIERLIINNKFVEILIIPNIIFNNLKDRNRKIYGKRIVVFFMIVFVSNVLLFYQLKNQIGYYPYKNLLIREE